MFLTLPGGFLVKHSAIPAPRRRDEALAVIIEWIARDGVSPTEEEIGDAMRPIVSRARVRELIGQLVKIGIIEKRPGLRGLRVRDMAQSRLMLVEAAKRLGWASPIVDLESPRPRGQLPMLPPFEHLPDVD